MDVFNRISEIFIYSGIIQGPFFALILFRNQKQRGKKSNRILAILLIILSASIAHSTLINTNLASPLKINEPFILLIGPLLFFYIHAIIGTRPFAFYDIFHFVPFIVLALIFLPLTTLNTPQDSFIINDIGLVSIGVWILTIIQYAFYWWKIIGLIHLSLTSLQTEFSNLEGKTLRWMKNLLHIFGICLFSLVITVPIAIHTNDYKLIDIIVRLSLVATVFVLVYEGLFQEEIFSNVAFVEPIEIDRAIVPEKVRTEQLSQEAGTLMQNLLAHMDEKKPYLEAGLTLTGLAQQLGMTRNQLSFLINRNTGDNFYNFINKYRVEEVKKIFSDPQKGNYTILAMAYEAGFPSKSSFHNIFKKVTGLTPTEYRNRQ